VKVDKPNMVYQALLKKGFIVRPVEMEGYLRVSVGTKNEVLSADFSSLHVVHMALNRTEKTVVRLVIAIPMKLCWSHHNRSCV
jgi:energy-converting hydrogenase A subunit M